MINITISTEIDVPADEAFAFLADFSNNPAWQSGVDATEWTSTPPIRVGSTYDQTVEFREYSDSLVRERMPAESSVITRAPRVLVPEARPLPDGRRKWGRSPAPVIPLLLLLGAHGTCQVVRRGR